MKIIDERIVKVKLEVNNTINTYQDLYIHARGTKYANALQNECEVTIKNLNKQTRDYILTETSPYNLNYVPKTITIEAGRKSYGTSQIYIGNIVSADFTQPPDVGIVLKCLTGNFLKGAIIQRNQPSQVQLSQIAKQVNQDMNTLLAFQATDKTLANYSFAGAALKQINHLSETGGVNVFMDDNTLVVKDKNTPLVAEAVTINSNTGMIGIPELTEWGIRVTCLADTKPILGGSIVLTSILNPAVNGRYVVYKLGFDIATREDPFYYIVEAARIQ